MEPVSEEALKTLGSFAKYVQRHGADVSQRLTQLAIGWANEKGVPLSDLLQALQSSD